MAEQELDNEIIEDEIDHEYTNEITCPYCGEEFGDSWEVRDGEEELGLQECSYCEKEFYAYRQIEITYSTEKAKYGTCKHCKQSNVVVEDWNSSVGKYAGLCVACGKKEHNKLMMAYIKRMEKERNQNDKL